MFILSLDYFNVEFPFKQQLFNIEYFFSLLQLGVDRWLAAWDLRQFLVGEVMHLQTA